MKYLLDTNIISETVKSHPNEKVIIWLQQIPSESIFISVITLGEIRKGVEKLHPSKRKDILVLWLETELPRWFEDRILPIDIEVAEKWGYITAQSQRPLPAIDSLIAATALTHNLKIVTRNSKDFDLPGLQVFNPFEL